LSPNMNEYYKEMGSFLVLSHIYDLLDFHLVGMCLKRLTKGVPSKTLQRLNLTKPRTKGYLGQREY
jgi:hypothetical protein